MSPRTQLQNEQIKLKSKQQIVHAAFSLFAKNGYSNTSIAKIASEAGVSKGLVYNYFHSKEDLLRGIFEMMLDQFESLWKFDKEDDPKLILKYIFDETFNFLDSHSEFSRLLTLLTLQKEIMITINPILEEIKNSKFDLIIPVIKDLGFEDPEEEAFFIGAVLDGIIVGKLAQEDTYPYEKMKTRLYKQYQIER